VRELIMKEAEQVMQRLIESISDPVDRNYYQGKIDTLSWILKQLPDK
jgi:hypothetical protein